MTQEDSWMTQYREIMQYMRKHQHRPSKHRPEDKKMHYWIKYNKRLLAKGELSHHREWRFKRLLAKAESLRRVNQYAYMPMPKEEELGLDFHD